MTTKLSDLKEQIRSHAIFFDRLVDLIPARFYVPAPDKERPWFHGLSEAAKISAKKESRENVKKARRARFDHPEKIASTLDLLKRTIEDEKKSLDVSEEEKLKSESDSRGDGEAEVENPRSVTSGDRSITYEELRQRLHRRIEELRGNRNTRPSDKPNNDKMQHRKGGHAPQGKHNRDEEVGKDANHPHHNDDDTKETKDKTAKVVDISYGHVKLGGLNERGMKKRKLSKKQELEMAKKLGSNASQGKHNRDEEVGKGSNHHHHDDDHTRETKDKTTKDEDISYGQVKLGGLNERGMKKRKLSKKQELDMAKKLDDARKDPEKGKVISNKLSWKAAMSRAVGEKVHDDPKVLLQSLKKEQKRHQKNADKWKDRIESQSKVREEKQRTRNENIRERIQQKKKRRIEKREKKLMRPGFEGRKDGYINE